MFEIPHTASCITKFSDTNFCCSIFNDQVATASRQLLDYYKAQKLFAERGMKADKPAMHMVFTGNPGTAKTSVARLFARIMKDNGLLSKGNLIEVGRGDLVGKYVGWTAPTIQKKFREAQGYNGSVVKTKI